MAAPTTYGAGIHGLADEPTVYMESFNLEMTTEQSFSKNHDAADVGVAIYNEQSSVTYQYFMETANTHLGSLAGVLTGAAGNLAILTVPSADTTPEMFVTGFSTTNTNSDFQRGTTTTLHRPEIASQ